jgi:hypothetical protein
MTSPSETIISTGCIPFVTLTVSNRDRHWNSGLDSAYFTMSRRFSMLAIAIRGEGLSVEARSWWAHWGSST